MPHQSRCGSQSTMFSVVQSAQFQASEFPGSATLLRQMVQIMQEPTADESMQAVLLEPAALPATTAGSSAHRSKALTHGRQRGRRLPAAPPSPSATTCQPPIA